MRKRNDKATLHQLGERGFIDQFLSSLTLNHPNRFVVPPGDDAAVLKDSHRTVLSIDGITDGVHFKSSWSKNFRKKYGFEFGRALGWKAMGGALSDLAAMGDIRSRWALVFLGAPAHTKTSLLLNFHRGVQDFCRTYRCALVGGDTVASKVLTLVVAVGGEAGRSRLLMRGTAQPGDLLCVTGGFGDAEIGLDILTKKIQVKQTQARRYFVKRFFSHQPMFNEGKILSKNSHVTSLIDLSDPLIESIELLLKPKKVGALVDLSLAPFSGPFRRHFNGKSNPPRGGEDYGLLFTLRPKGLLSLKKKLPFSVIGSVTSGNKSIDVRWFGQKISSKKGF